MERKLADGPPCVLLASPCMLQSGMSRELLELWAPDNRNGLIVTGYSVEGTMARVSPALSSSQCLAYVNRAGNEFGCLFAMHHESLTAL